MSYRLAAILGISAFCLPEQAPWTLLTAFISTILLITSTQNKTDQIISMLVGVSTFLFTASGLLSASLSISVISALVVFRNNRLLALIIICLQLSYLTSIEALAANFLHQWNLEASAPALLTGIFLLLIQMRFSFLSLILVTSPVCLVWVLHHLELGPLAVIWISAIPVLILTAITPAAPRSNVEGLPRIIVVSIFAACIAGWILTPPKSSDKTYVVLPESGNSSESRFYDNYQEVLRFAGIPAEVVQNENTIPPHSLVLLPWLTATNSNQDQTFFSRIRKLALEREWTVLMVGEHNNMGGVSDKIIEITGTPYLRNDLSVPYRNTDNSGIMRSSDIRAWYAEAMLNRGASVEVFSPLNRVLLSGDGWWAEPDIDEWLWVGDYDWQPKDRHGRLAMALTATEKNTTWVILGDTGPFINQQLVSDPRPALRIIELATLWPTFFRDISLILIATCIVLGFSISVNLGIVAASILAAVLHSTSVTGSWSSLWHGESAFDEGNFNLNLISSKTLLTTDWKLERAENPLEGKLEITQKPTVIFGLVNDTLTIENTTISSCRRLGSVATEKVYLMDAQACRVDGEAEILVGDKNEAAILKIGAWLLILDNNFLGQKAPKINQTWLEKFVIESSR